MLREFHAGKVWQNRQYYIDNQKCPRSFREGFGDEGPMAFIHPNVTKKYLCIGETWSKSVFNTSKIEKITTLIMIYETQLYYNCNKHMFLS